MAGVGSADFPCVALFNPISTFLNQHYCCFLLNPVYLCSSIFFPLSNLFCPSIQPPSHLDRNHTSLVLCPVKWPKDLPENWLGRKASEGEDSVVSQEAEDERRGHVHGVFLSSYTQFFTGIVLRLKSFLVLPGVPRILATLPLMFHHLPALPWYSLFYVCTKYTYLLSVQRIWAHFSKLTQFFNSFVHVHNTFWLLLLLSPYPLCRPPSPFPMSMPLCFVTWWV